MEMIDLLAFKAKEDMTVILDMDNNNISQHRMASQLLLLFLRSRSHHEPSSCRR